MKIVAIIPAGGLGKRMGCDLFKQYLTLDDIPVLVYTLGKFERALIVDDVILVVPEDYVEYSKREIVEKYSLSKVGNILVGGKERQDSVKSGLDTVDDNTDVVIIHDGVRPFVSEELINISVAAALKDSAVAIGVPVTDTVKSVDGDGFIERTIDRKSLWSAQTPQTFRREIIKKAYEKAYDDNFYGTDDASLVERIGINVRMIMGSYDNIKITTPEDLVLGAEIIKRLKS